MKEKPRLSHLAADGSSHMVDVGGKAETRRTATAEALVRFSSETFPRILAGDLPKGGILEPARIAGIQAAKQTANLIPMCHPLLLDQVEVEIHPLEGGVPVLRVRCRASLSGRTGVEMEAMTGAAVAALTLYDMTKGLDKGIQLENVRLLEKIGGKSGRWQAQ